MDNKLIYEKWLQTFKKGADGKKFKSAKAYLGYMSLLEKDMNFEKDKIYTINKVKQLEDLEKRLSKTHFTKRQPKQQKNLLSALHVYKNLIEILSTQEIKGKAKSKG